MILAIEEAKYKLINFRADIEELGSALRIEVLRTEVEDLEKKTLDADFWNDQQTSGKILREIKQKKDKIEAYEKLKNKLEDTITLAELALEENDEGLTDEILSEVSDIETEEERQRIEILLSGEYDRNNAIVSFHPGAGGTEAQDWALMLYRMYTRWGEKHGYNVKLIDWLDGEEAGIKTAVYEVAGPHAYGTLKSEHGVHRLVRLSPFNADNLRQTSFSLVEILPVIKTADEVKIDDKDLRIDVYHSGGHGGQSVNTTNSAVRITHLPTNTVVAIQNERSQLQNKEKAMEILRGKLARLQQEQQAESIDKLRAGESAKWGQQIRNYVLQPYKLVKDTRTKYEETNADAVLDGDINNFIEAYLESRIGE